MTGCELQFPDYSGRVPRIVTCRATPARMVLDTVSGWGVAMCEVCYGRMGKITAQYLDLSRPWAEHPLQRADERP